MPSRFNTGSTYVDRGEYGLPRDIEYPFGLPEGLPTTAFSNGLASSLVVFSGQGRLIGFQGYSNKASAQFILVFDLSSLPADGAVPWFGFAAGIGAGNTTGNYSVYFGSDGAWFNEGCVLCNSSTVATKTIGSADTSFNAQYVPQVI